MRHKAWIMGILLAIVLAFTIERYLHSDLFVILSDLQGASFIYIVVLLVVLFAGFFVIVEQQSQESLWNLVLPAGIPTVIIACAIFGYLTWSDYNRVPLAIILSAGMATVGWLVQTTHSQHIQARQHEVTRDLQRKQHTLNVLTQMRQSLIFNKHRDNLFQHYPPNRGLTQNEIEDLLRQRESADNYTAEGKYPVLESIIYIANYYEFLSAAVMEDDIDEHLLDESLGRVMEGFYKKVRPYLDEKLELDDNSVPQSTLYKNYWRLMKKWNAL